MQSGLDTFMSCRFYISTTGLCDTVNEMRSHFDDLCAISLNFIGRLEPGFITYTFQVIWGCYKEPRLSSCLVLQSMKPIKT